MKKYRLITALVLACGTAIYAQQPAPAKTDKPAPAAQQPAPAKTDKPAAQQPAPVKTHLKVGDPAPDFTLIDTNRKTVKLSDYKGKKSVVLAFYILAFTGG